MRRGAGIALLLVFLVPTLAGLALRLGLGAPAVNFALDHALRGRTPLEVRVGSFRWDFFRSLEAGQVVVLAPVQGAKLPLLTLDRLTVEYNPKALLGGRRGWRTAVNLVRLHGLKLFVLRGAKGAWNLSPLRQGGLGAPRPDMGPGFGPLPVCKVEFDDSAVVLNDEFRGFRASMDRIEGNFDTRRPPWVAFTLAGHTEGHAQRNLAFSGLWNQGSEALAAHLNLRDVALARYLNYFLPVAGLRFTAGTASLHIQLDKSRGRPVEASGRADLEGGALSLPGVGRPLSRIQGTVAFDSKALRFRDARAYFLGSDWAASGAILDLGDPRFDVTVTNPAVPLAALSQQVRGLGTLALTGSAEVAATLRGPVAAPQVAATLKIPELGIVGFEVQNVGVAAALAGRRLRVESLRGDLWGGELEGNAAMDLRPGGALKADLSLVGALLQSARFRGRALFPGTGLTQARLKVSGLLGSPDLDLDFKVGKLRLGLWDLGDLTAHAVYAQGGLRGDFSSGQGLLAGVVAFSRGKGPGGRGEPVFHDTLVTVKGLHLGNTARNLASTQRILGLPDAAQTFVQAVADHLSADLDAALTVEGPLRAPWAYVKVGLSKGLYYPRAKSRLAKARLEALSFGLDGTVGWHGSELLLGRDGVPLRAQLGPKKQGLSVEASGAFPWSSGPRAGHIGVAVLGDMRLLDSFGGFSKSRGSLKGHLDIGGSFAGPLAKGSLEISGFSAEPKAYLAPVRDGHLKLLFHGAMVELVGLHATAPGALDATGHLDLTDGLEGLRGSLELRTDAQGLRIQNWDSMGAGSLVFSPLEVGLSGGDQPYRISGKIQLNDAHVVYAGGASDAGAPAGVPSFWRRPLSLDLRVGVGPNVWYEKINAQAVDLSDPRKWIGDTLQSAKDTLIEPDVSFKLAPTQRDFEVHGTTPDLSLAGELTIARGRITVMENNFDITSDRGPAVIHFQDNRADVNGTAVARLSYTRNDPVTGRPRQKSVQVFAIITPRSQADLDAQGGAAHFLNYQLAFDSDPQIIPDDAELQQTAVVDLVMLGDPLVDVGDPSSGAAAGSGAADQGSLLADSGVGTLFSGLARKELDQFLRKYKILSGNWFDVVRVTPRIRYQTAGAASAGQGVPGVQPLSGASQSQYDIDWAFELGKSFGEKLYASLQMLSYGENSRDSVLVDSQSNYTVQDYGARAGLEFQLNSYRSIDVYGDFGCDDYLNPVAYDPSQQFNTPNIGYLVQLRNTIPTDNYSAALARKRRWETTQGVRP